MSHFVKQKRVFLAVTGASGAIYAERCLRALLDSEEVQSVYLCFSNNAKRVISTELSKASFLNSFVDSDTKNTFEGKLKIFEQDDLFAPIASGTSVPTDMIVLPASMGTVSKIVHGASSSLIERAADCVLKQKKNLVICPRETPFNTIHLENLLRLSQIGVQIIPLMPGFYFRPKSIEELIDFMVARVLDQISIHHTLSRRWNPSLI